MGFEVRKEFLIIGIISFILVAIAIYYLICIMKGKIDFEITQKAFNPCEQITARVLFSTRKPLQVNRLYVALIGYLVITRYNSNGDRKR